MNPLKLNQQLTIEMKKEAIFRNLFQRLSLSSFRSRFHLKRQDKQYVSQKGLDTIRQHASDFIRARLAPCHPANDGQQTPMKGHPVFIAQHATGTCCRQCLYKWHKIAPNTPLTENQQRYIVSVIMRWITQETEAKELTSVSR